MKTSPRPKPQGIYRAGRRRRERGQALTEQIILVAMAMLALLGVVGLFLDGIGNFYQNVMTLVCLPLP